MNRYIFQGSNSLFMFGNFFSYKTRPHSEGLIYCPWKQTGSHKSCSPFCNMAEKQGGVPIHLNKRYMYVSRLCMVIDQLVSKHSPVADRPEQVQLAR